VLGVRAPGWHLRAQLALECGRLDAGFGQPDGGLPAGGSLINVEGNINRVGWRPRRLHGEVGRLAAALGDRLRELAPQRIMISRSVIETQGSLAPRHVVFKAASSRTHSKAGCARECPDSRQRGWTRVSG
jgi:hypothetical protein